MGGALLDKSENGEKQGLRCFCVKESHLVFKYIIDITPENWQSTGDFSAYLMYFKSSLLNNALTQY